ncbi:MAG: hypothetical protein ACK6AY_04890, partial [Akkermansiaceae bacterium]
SRKIRETHHDCTPCPRIAQPSKRPGFIKRRGLVIRIDYSAALRPSGENFVVLLKFTNAHKALTIDD